MAENTYGHRKAYPVHIGFLYIAPYGMQVFGGSPVIEIQNKK
jgi:hypothetical protein